MNALGGFLKKVFTARKQKKEQRERKAVPALFPDKRTVGWSPINSFCFNGGVVGSKP
jgi:hypothetical protein